MTTRAQREKNKESKRGEKVEERGTSRERQHRAELKEYEKEEVNNESHKGKILRTNESQINCVMRGSDEGQWGNPGSRASAANTINQTGNCAEERPYIRVR